MQVLPIDLTAIIAIIMGMLVILIPVAGITARFALKPTVEALAKLFEKQGLEDTVGILEQRMSLLESQMESMDASLRRIADVVEFDHELRSGGEEKRLPRAEPEERTARAPGAGDGGPGPGAGRAGGEAGR